MLCSDKQYSSYQSLVDNVHVTVIMYMLDGFLH